MKSKWHHKEQTYNITSKQRAFLKNQSLYYKIIGNQTQSFRYLFFPNNSIAIETTTDIVNTPNCTTELQALIKIKKPGAYNND